MPFCRTAAKALGEPIEELHRERNLRLLKSLGCSVEYEVLDIGDPADAALRDRRTLSADGIFIVVATVSVQSGESVVPPEVIFRGVPFIEQADELVAEIREEVERSLSNSARDGVREIDLLQTELHDHLAAFVYERMRRRPMVLPVVVEV